MTRILYWNIENFAFNKIQSPMVRRQKGASVKAYEAARDRLAYIIKHVRVLNPDILVLVEVEAIYATTASRGTLARGAGALGVKSLRMLMRTKFLPWRLVPPLVTGPNEAVGVFYNENTVQFTGPNLWSGGYGPAQPGGTGAGYPDIWKSSLPKRAINSASSFNPGGQEAHCAAVVAFASAAAANAQPSVVDFGDRARNPYLTTFWDIAGGRDIRLFSIHAPAIEKIAIPYLTTLAGMPAISARPDNCLIVGDFNVNALSGNNTYSENYKALTDTGYVLGLLPDSSGNPAGQYRGYFATHMAPVRSFKRESGTSSYAARCDSTDIASSYYPTYGYTGSRYGTKVADAIDNVLYVDTLDKPPKITIANGLVGSPYNRHASGKGPPGSAKFPPQIMWPNRANYKHGPAPPQKGYLYGDWKGVRKWFSGWNAYGKIRSVSDHLPLVIDF